MRRAAVAIALLLATTGPDRAAEWRLEIVPAPGRVSAIHSGDAKPLVAIGAKWFRAVASADGVTLVAAAAPIEPPRPDGALPDGRIAIGKRDIARTWLAGPTSRYRHGALGDPIEAGSLVIERRNGAQETVRLGPDAVFEDLEPRIVELDRTGREFVVVVKSYLKTGSALAVIGERATRFTVLAETPPIGTAHRWLNPAGFGDFNHDGSTELALVRMPHALGRLELWSWRGDTLQPRAQVADVTNHVFGTRVQRMSAVADFDGDGRPDLAIPAFDRRALRLIAFAPATRDIARIELPARAMTELAAIKDGTGRLAVLLGLDNGRLVLVRRAQ